MKRLYKIILLLLITSIGYAQVPGYLGKRAFVYFSPNLTPAIFNQNINNSATFNLSDNEDTPKSSITAFNYKPQFSFEYLLGQKFGVGVDYSLLRTGTSHVYQVKEERSVDFDVLKGHSIGMHMKFYRFKKSNSIAPIGKYINLKAEYVTYNTYDDKNSSESIFENDFNYFVITYEAGKQAIIGDFMVVHYGVEFGLALVPDKHFEDNDINWTVQQDSAYRSHGSLFNYSIFNLKLGIGSLLF